LVVFAAFALFALFGNVVFLHGVIAGTIRAPLSFHALPLLAGLVGASARLKVCLLPEITSSR
jgi:hypothetical protein